MTETASLQTAIAACLDGYAENHRLSPRQWQVCRHVLDCRTAALGGLALQCDTCAEKTPAYHACRDRHCPRCQRRATEEWCAKQRAAVLPVTYHHLVFTLPHVLNPWVEIHDREIYSLLFEAVRATLSAFGLDPKRLGGQLGMRQAINDGRFKRIVSNAQVGTMLDALMEAEWVVYSKSCLCRTETVVDYLGRYSHRIAPSDARVLSVDDGQVDLAYKDYRDGHNKVMSLSAEELLRRFLLHVLPKGFMRIRHFGFLANRCRRQRLTRIRTSIKAKEADAAARTREEDTLERPCPKCRKGRLRVVGEIAPRKRSCGYRSG